MNPSPSAKAPETTRPPVPGARRSRTLLPALGRFALRAVAVAYLAGLWVDAAVGSDYLRALPTGAALFLQVAALFPDASIAITEYRAEGWLCDEQRWEEIETTAHFPLDSEHKENRFQRALFLYANQPAVLDALDAYLVERHNTGESDDGRARGHAIGGVRIDVLKTPLPIPGGAVARYVRRPLGSFSSAETQALYQTSESARALRCGAAHQGNLLDVERASARNP